MSVFITVDIARKAAEILQRHFVGLAAAMYGKNAVTDDEWNLAVQLGFVDPTAPRETLASMMPLFGAFLAHLGDAQLQKRYGTTAEEWVSEVARNPVPRTPTEIKAAKFSALRAAQHVVGLGNKLGAVLGSTLIEADRNLDKQLRSMIQDVVAAKYGDDEAAARIKKLGADKGFDDNFLDGQFRSTSSRMASDMGHLTKDWARDWRRIAMTEAQGAFNEGLKDRWQEQELERASEEDRPPNRIRAYKIPKPDACKHCIRLHLESGSDHRIFYLDELEGNGDNVGRRANDWRAVIGTTHPHCACSLVKLPSYIELPKGWKSGGSAPSVVDSSGMLVLPE